MSQALQVLEGNIVKNIDYVRQLEERVTNLTIENTKLHNRINALNEMPKEVDKEPPVQHVERVSDVSILSEKATQDIDLSLNQLKNLFDKKK